MRATTLHDVRDIRLSEVPDPTIEQPTDAIVRVTAACICGSDLWPYRGENPITAGSTIGHECIGVVEEIGSDVTGIRVGDFVVVPFDHCDNTCAHCRVGMQSACVNLGMTVSGQGEYARVTQADGSLVRIDQTPAEAASAGLVPSLLALSDVMPTGWHAAVAAGVRAGGSVVVVGDGAVGLCGV
ncbi:MAG: alcohol dehydrogenase catalytic domain-containing protein, partial [Actinobacteria bacterium]|nr:alcohol dehydrogenase catalytic domain-containing protein [Actinomycetota bacterium]